MKLAAKVALLMVLSIGANAAGDVWPDWAVFAGWFGGALSMLVLTS